MILFENVYLPGKWIFPLFNHLFADFAEWKYKNAIHIYYIYMYIHIMIHIYIYTIYHASYVYLESAWHPDLTFAHYQN